MLESHGVGGTLKEGGKGVKRPDGGSQSCDTRRPINELRSGRAVHEEQWTGVYTGGLNSTPPQRT